jgi:hypothetical protein
VPIIEPAKAPVKRRAAHIQEARNVPGSTDIVVDVASVERAHRSEMPDWQFRGGASSVGRYPALTNEPFQQCFHGNTLPPGLVSEAGFGFA